jgi:hypothetical protein
MLVGAVWWEGREVVGDGLLIDGLTLTSILFFWWGFMVAVIVYLEKGSGMPRGEEVVVRSIAR